MKGNAAINPQKNSREIDRQVLMAEQVFLFVAVAITSVGFFVWGRSAAAQYIDNQWIQTAIGILAAAASAFVTDFAFRHFLEEVVYQALAAAHPNVQGRVGQPVYFKVLNVVRWLVLTLVVVALFWADWNSVMTIKDPFADSANQRETTNITTATASLSTQLNSASAPMAEQIAALKSDITAAERRTTAANVALVDLARSGNGWASRELEKKKTAATRSSRRELDKLQAAYTGALSENSAVLTRTTADLKAENEQITLANQRKRESLSTMFFMFGAGSKALTVLLRIFLVVSFLSKTPTLDANGDGVIDGRDVTAAAGGGESFR